MDADRWRELKRLFEGARELQEPDRSEWLQRECGANAALRAEVDAMLRKSALLRDYLEPPESVGDIVIPRSADGGFSAGAVVGEFQIIRRLGEGGMGVVFEALQPSLGRRVALKILPPSLLLRDRDVERFRREAHAAAQLSHPGIVRVFAIAYDEPRQAHYFAMELVEGCDLHTALESIRRVSAVSPGAPQVPKHDSRDYIPWAAGLAADVAEALQHAHERRIIHRDVKPHNLLLDGAGKVHVGDFGLARDDSFGTVTRTGESGGGSPYYMSPEQARTQRNRVDHRTDVYSLGVVLYEMLALKRPFEGKTSQEVLLRVERDEPASLRRSNARVPRDLEVICAKAMAKVPADRYPTAGELAADLRRFLAHEAIVASPPSLGKRLRRWLIRSRNPALVAAAAVVAASGGIAWSERRVAALELRNELDAVRPIAAAASWDGIPRAALRAAWERLVSLRARASALHQQDNALVDRLWHRFQSFGDGVLQNAGRLLEAGAARPTGDVEDQQLLDGLLAARDGALVFPDDPRFQRLLPSEQLSPRVSIRVQWRGTGPAPGGRVSRRAIDSVAEQVGAKEPLGSLPCVERPIPAGYQRIIVEFDNGEVRELTRQLRFGPRPYEFEVTADPIDRSRDDMVTIASCAAIMPEQHYVFCRNSGKLVAVAAFAMDRREVSVGEYGQYLAATGTEPPDLWQDWPDIARFSALPAFGVAWIDAQRYAEWHGKRLPTHTEWEVAARGCGEWRLYPWRAEGSPKSLARVGRRRANDWRKVVPDARDVVLESAAEVDTYQGGASPNGILHLFGNVAEFTESMIVHDHEGQMRESPWERMVMGCAFDAADDDTLARHRTKGIDRSHAGNDVGFRCVRSIEP